MESFDDDLKIFEANGAKPLPDTGDQGYVDHENSKIWYTTYGSGLPVIMLHGGLGHSGNWGYQVPMLINSGFRVVLIDSRGHGHSTRDSQPYTYELMASDVVAVMNTLNLENAVFIGWSDGACIALIMAMKFPARVKGVFFFGCNMDPSGTKEVDQANPLLERCFNRHIKDYTKLSATPDQFKAFASAVGQMMQTQPNYSAKELVTISIPVVIVQSEFDEFIKYEHAKYLADTIPGAEFIFLPEVSHFAPLQRPSYFYKVMFYFLEKFHIQ